MINMHEREDTKKTRKTYINNFKKLEINESCQIQFKKYELIKVLKSCNIQEIRQKVLLETAYYDSETNVHEFYADKDETFIKLASHLLLWGYLSIRKICLPK